MAAAAIIVLAGAVGVVGVADTVQPLLNSPSSGRAANLAGPAARPVAPAAPIRPAPPASPGTDDRGFVNSFARCDGALTAVVLGRTAGAVAAICRAANGQFIYRGARLNRPAVASLSRVRATATGFEARNDDTVYTLSRTELVITAGTSVVVREPMLAFEDRRAPPPAPAAAQPAVEFPTAPLTSRGVGNATVRFTATAPWRLTYVVQCPADTAVLGFIDAGSPKGVVYHSNELRGDTSSSREGTSRRMLETGPTVLTINTADPGCAWTVSV